MTTPRVRAVDVLVASTWGSARRTQTRRFLLAGTALALAAVGASAASGTVADAGSVRGVVDGLAAGAPLVALVLGALGTAGWASNGTAVLVAPWVPRRTTLALAELIGSSVVTLAATLFVAAAAVGAEVGRGVVAGADPEVLVGAAGPPGPVVTATALAAVSGAALGLLLRAPAGAVLVLAATTWFVEPAVVGLAGGPGHSAAGWLRPVTALAQLSGTTLLGPAGGLGGAGPPGQDAGPAPLAVALVWAALLTAGAVVTFDRRDLA